MRYSIVLGDDNRDFTISEDGGVIRVAKNLNFERKSRYRLTVRAEDCAPEIGGVSRDDTSEVIITVLDINDNAPVFLDSPYLAHVMENLVPPSGGFVIQVCCQIKRKEFIAEEQLKKKAINEKSNYFANKIHKH